MLEPFSGVLLLVCVYLIIWIFSQAPLILTLAVLPFLAFVVWWFGTLYIFAHRFRVLASEKGLTITVPESAFAYMTVQVAWDEIIDVECKIDPAFNPKYFTGRNMKLVLRLPEKKEFIVDQVSMIDDYPSLFAHIQRFRPFVYQLPAEQQWDIKIKQLVVIVLLCVLFVLSWILFL